MATEQDSALDAQKSLLLKLDELQVNSSSPWSDDLLGRKGIATRLTNIVATQKPPLTISLHGQWGTGKTFLLRRWQQALKNDGYQAIYFNAWEDDFSDDPLLSILGQLVESLHQGIFRESLVNVRKSALPLLRSNFSSLLNRHTGLTTEFKRALPTREDLFKDYLIQRNTKDQLRENLKDLSDKVQRNSSHPLVFIIDELDRCRPTFAIELLERVKHIFDVPNTVFVFGLNRDELRKSLASVYGNIQTDVYLRRFFDFEFNLPESDSQGFVLHLIDKFQIREAFLQLANASGQQGLMVDLNNYRTVIPGLWSALGLSLRDIDYGIRLLTLLAKSVTSDYFTHPFLLAVLIAVKFKKPELFTELINGNIRTDDIMDYIEETVRRDLVDEALTSSLDRIEGFLYCADSRNKDGHVPGSEAGQQLTKLLQNDFSSEPELAFLSQRARNANNSQRKRIIEATLDGRTLRVTDRTFGQLATLIDTHQAELRR